MGTSAHLPCCRRRHCTVTATARQPRRARRQETGRPTGGINAGRRRPSRLAQYREKLHKSNLLPRISRGSRGSSGPCSRMPNSVKRTRRSSLAQEVMKTFIVYLFSIRTFNWYFRMHIYAFGNIDEQATLF